MAFDLIETGSRLLSANAGTAAIAAAELTKKIPVGVQPQFAYLWEFVVRGVTGEREELKFYAQNTTIPSMNKDPITVEYCGTTFFYQGKHSNPKRTTVRFYDSQDLDIYRFFYEWYTLMDSSDESKGSVNPINYMKQAEIRMVDTTERIITEQFIFDDCFPMMIGDISLDYASSELMTFDVTFQYRKMQLGYGLLDAIEDVGSIVRSARSLF